MQSAVVAKEQQESDRPPAGFDFEIREIARSCEDIPEFVRNARFTQISQRILDSNLFNAIISQSPSPAEDKHWADRLELRRKALIPHIGKLLTCVFVRLPGVHYTIEIDPAAKKVVYWEWQSI